MWWVCMKNRQKKRGVIESKIKIVDSVSIQLCTWVLQSEKTSATAITTKPDIWICLVHPPPSPEPLTGGKKKKKKHLNTTRLQSPSNTALRSRVKPLCLHLTSKTNTPQFRSMQTPEYKCVRGQLMALERGTHGKKWKGAKSRTKHKLLQSNMNVYLLNLLSVLFLSLPSSPSLGVIYAAGTELCIGAAWSWLEQW